MKVQSCFSMRQNAKTYDYVPIFREVVIIF